MSEAAKSQEKTYQVSKSLHFSFDAIEDRLIIETTRGKKDAITVSLTRRMVILILKQLLNHLPTMAQLKQTPSQYWEDVLRMSHQQALEARKTQSKKVENDSEAVSTTPVNTDPLPEAETDIAAASSNFLADEVIANLQNKKLILAFNGYGVSDDFKIENRQQIFATVLQVEQVHQLIQLLINKAHVAMWHLPVDLSWVEQPGNSPRSARSTMQIKH